MKEINSLPFEEAKEVFKTYIPQIEKEHDIKILFAYVRGSHLYNLDTPTSDVDITFVYRCSTHNILKNSYVPYIDISGTGDVVGFEVQNVLELLSNANPTMLEILGVPERCVIFSHNNFQSRLHTIKWLTTKTKDSILGYAYSQIRKATGLNKKMNNPQPKERRPITDFCYIIHDSKAVPLGEHIEKLYPEFRDVSKWGLVKVPVGKGLYSVYITSDSTQNFRGLIKDDSSPQLRLSSIPKEYALNHIPKVMYYNQDGFEVHCKEWKEYWEWVESVGGDKNVQLREFLKQFRLA